MTYDEFITRLDGVRTRSAGRANAKCPAHDDRSPSLSVADRGDGGILVHCFAGCSVDSIVAALGLALADLMPPRAPDPLAPPTLPSRFRMPLAEALEMLALEVTVVDLAAAALLRGEPLTDADLARLADAVERIHDVRLAVYGGDELARRAAAVVSAPLDAACAAEAKAKAEAKRAAMRARH